MKSQLAALVLMLTTTFLFAQKTVVIPFTTFYGSADAYYKYWSNPLIIGL